MINLDIHMYLKVLCSINLLYDLNLYNLTLQRPRS